MSLDRPKLRADLVARPVHRRGRRYIELSDPKSGARLWMSDLGYSVAYLMDGSTHDEVIARTWDALHTELSRARLDSFIERLASRGYLEGTRASTAAAELDVVTPGPARGLSQPRPFSQPMVEASPRRGATPAPHIVRRAASPGPEARLARVDPEWPLPSAARDTEPEVARATVALTGAEVNALLHDALERGGVPTERRLGVQGTPPAEPVIELQRRRAPVQSRLPPPFPRRQPAAAFRPHPEVALRTEERAVDPQVSYLMTRVRWP